MITALQKIRGEFMELANVDVFSCSKECWNWLGKITPNNYGTFCRLGELSAHRLAYKLFVGRIPKGLSVLHKCDNPGCVNPFHLFIGSQVDNIKDCENKNRDLKRHGSEHPYAILTENQIPEIFKLKQQGMVQNDIARKFNVAPMTISDILRRKTWKHVTI